jgi:hypothetical protein
LPRQVSTAAAAQLVASYVRMAVFVSAQFLSETSYVWSGFGPITTPAGLAVPAQTWKGLGALGSIGTIAEDSTLTAQGITIGLSGIDPDLLGDCMAEVQQGLPVNIYLVFFNADGTIIDGIMCYSGRMDQPSFDEGVDKCTITIACENRLSDLQRASQRRYTYQDQAQRYPADKGLRYIAQSQDWNGGWGQGSDWSNAVVAATSAFAGPWAGIGGGR